jgi:hypothetical protein
MPLILRVFCLLKNICKIGSGGNRMLFLHTVHLHAKMFSFDNYHYPERDAAFAEYSLLSAQ